jgi:hypothetical protein
VFFGFEALLGGWLVFRSGFLPRFLGALSMVLAIAGVLVTAGWVFLRGVDDAT